MGWSAGRLRASACAALCVLGAACSEVAEGAAAAGDAGEADDASHAGGASAPPPNDADASALAPSFEVPADPVVSPFVQVLYVVLDHGPTYGCAAGFDASAAIDIPSAVQAAQAHCEGEEGRWSCVCDASATTSYAAGCIGALFEACGVDAEPLTGSASLPRDCEAMNADRAGRCAATASADYACRCAGRPDAEVTRADARCELALWAACAQSCSNELGSCEPRPGEPPGAYRCHSLANGLDHDVRAASCTDALTDGLGIFDEYMTCNGYGGFCDRVGDDALHCTCADGNEHDAVYVANRYAPCRSALEAVCGVGDAPLDAVCALEGNGYAARCTREPATDAPHVCECRIVDADTDALAITELVPGLGCEAAATRVCPQVEPLSGDARTTVCEHYATCDSRYLGFDRDDCLQNAPDACVACTALELQRVAPGADGCPSERPQCGQACEDLVPKATAVAACEALLGERQELGDEGRCLCDRCHPVFGQCLADEGCTEIVDCAQSQGCDASTCEMDPVCGPLIASYEGTRSLALVLQLTSCEARDECAALASP